MSVPPDLEATALPQRLVLLALVELDVRDETPANELDVRACCGEHIDDVAATVLGEPSTVDVARALNELDASGLVAEVECGEESPVGKGRPTYALRVDATAVLDAFADDDRLDRLVERLRERGVTGPPD